MAEKEAEKPKENNQDQVLNEIKNKNLELAAEITRRETMLHQVEELRARELMSGKSQAVEVKPVEESPKDYMKRVMRGGK